ncbi:MAG: hypothetical protein O6703_07025 [Gammaproteobacteria bacterium]|nr:hypothetical protein [Gammaproteobacteria bacterium]
MADSIRIKNLIDGEWIVNGKEKTVALYTPSTGVQIGEVPMSSSSTAKAAVRSSDAAYLWNRLYFMQEMGQLMIDVGLPKFLPVKLASGVV